MLPKLVCEKGPQFRYQACRFENEEKTGGKRVKPPRTVVGREWGVEKCYAVYGSAHGYWTEERNTVPFTHQSMEDTGQRILEAISHYFLLKETLQRKRAARRGFRQQTDKSTMVEALPSGTMTHVLQQLKAYQISHPEDSLSDSSSSDSDLDTLPPEEQYFIHSSIKQVLASPKLPKYPIIRIKSPLLLTKNLEKRVEFSPNRSEKEYSIPNKVVFSRIQTDKLLRNRLITPLIPSKVVFDMSTERESSALRSERRERRDKSEGRVRMKCPQRGYGAVERGKVDVSPLRIDRIQGLVTRPSSRLLRKPIGLLQPPFHPTGAVTDRPLASSDRERRPVSTLRASQVEVCISVPRLS